MSKLGVLKKRMIETKITYASYEQTLWDFAELDIQIQNAVEQATATFSEVEKRKNVKKLIESLVEIEGDLIQAVSKTTTKESVKRFFNAKTFGTFE